MLQVSDDGKGVELEGRLRAFTLKSKETYVSAIVQRISQVIV